MKASKKGFTLLELLVVILIISVLMGVLVKAINGGSASARSAKCLANLRNLSTAAVSVAMNGGSYPMAGSVEHWEMVYTGSDFIYKFYEAQGWIGWYSSGAYHGNDGSIRKSLVKDNFPSWYISSYNTDKVSSGGEKDNKCGVCLKRGTLWWAVKGNREMYICPEHKKAVREKLKSKNMPNWSYVMNSTFGWQSKEKDGGFHGGPPDKGYGDIARPDKTIMFAELNWTKLPGCADPKYSTAPGTECDSVLQYAKGERIGFNHKTGRDWAAHVVFCDTHVEVIRFPKHGTTEDDLKRLTKYLCEGSDWAIKNGVFEKL